MTRQSPFRFRSMDGPRDWGWINGHLPLVLTEDTTAIMAVDVRCKDRPVAALVMDNWVTNSVQIHMVIDDPMVIRHGFIDFAADYVFNACDKGVVFASIPSTNTKALRLNRHLGMTEVARLRDAYEVGVDSVIMQLLRKDYLYRIKEPTARAA